MQENPPGEKLHTFKLPTKTLQRLDLIKPAQFLRIPHNQLPLLRLRTQATNYIPTHLHLNTLTPIPRMPNNIAFRVSPYKSLEMRFISPSTVPISFQSPNLQLESIASFSNFDNSIFGHGQLIQIPKK